MPWWINVKNMSTYTKKKEWNQQTYIALNVMFRKLWIKKFLRLSKETISIICSKCGKNNDTIFKEEESIEILPVLGLIEQEFHVN